MDVQSILQAITTVGFPIVCCVGLGWYVKYVTDRNREDINKITEMHRTEMSEMSVAINNNTIALQKLCDKLGE